MADEKLLIAPASQTRPAAQQEAPGPFAADEGLADAETLKLPAVFPRSRFRKARRLSLLMAVLVLLLAGALYCLWQGIVPAGTTTVPLSTPALSTPLTGDASPRAASSVTGVAATSADKAIQVYVVGAVKHPGVYSLPTGARVYQLLQAAGGPLPGADLVALNLAAPLSDGEEIYVRKVGERPPPLASGEATTVPPSTSSAGLTPTPVGGLVNINTASVDELRQRLHVSAKTAQNIVNYRSEHGLYTSVDQLLQVVSRSIYDRIKSMVTV